MLLQAHAHRPLAIGLAIRANAAHLCQPQRETCLYGARRLYTSAGIAITEPETAGESTVAPDAQAQPHLLQFRVPIFVLAMGRTRGNRCRLRVGRLEVRRCVVFIGPLEGDGRRILMEPKCRNGTHLECFERTGAAHLVQVRST